MITAIHSHLSGFCGSSEIIFSIRYVWGKFFRLMGTNKFFTDDQLEKALGTISTTHRGKNGPLTVTLKVLNYPSQKKFSLEGNIKLSCVTFP